MNVNSATPTHTDEKDHQEQVKQFLAAWDVRPFDQSQLERFIAPDYVDHTRPQSDPALSDRDVLIGLGHTTASGFPDGRHKVILIEPVSDSRILVYWQFTGTHTGTFFGIPATGRRVEFVGTDLFTLRDGKITQHYHVEELLKVMTQLGVVGSAG
jgi:predicted ester cyclase